MLKTQWAYASVRPYNYHTAHTSPKYVWIFTPKPFLHAIDCSPLEFLEPPSWLRTIDHNSRQHHALHRPRLNGSITALHRKLENVAINDVLPLKAARRDAIANFKCFWAPGDDQPNLIFSFTFAMRRHFIRFASASFTSGFAKFGWVTFAVCNAWQRSKTQNLRCVSKTSGPSLTVCRPKSTKFQTI